MSNISELAFDELTDVWQLGILLYFLFYNLKNINEMDIIDIYQGKDFIIPEPDPSIL